jgi:hypothetical protein
VLTYRDCARAVSGPEIVAELVGCLRGCVIGGERRHLEAFLRAADLECALADAGSSVAATAQFLTDALCDAWRGRPGHSVGLPPEAVARKLQVPKELRLRTPEGYAYFGLDPLGYAELARRQPLGTRRVIVIGVRSIGVSLSAVVASTLRERGANVERTTVRPTGHPWNRTLTFEQPLGQGLDSEFIVVDEGPGLSGSTFLAVGEALLRAGVRPECITFFGSRDFDPRELRTERAVERWAPFGRRMTSNAPLAGAGIDWSGGLWRRDNYDTELSWPAAWVELERVKRVNHDTLLKFEGLPPYDAEPVARSRSIHEAGFGPRVSASTGYLCGYELCRGRPGGRGDVSEALLDRMSAYLTFRARAFKEEPTDPRPLEEMARCNVREALERELPQYFNLRSARPIVADARMQPEEWWLREDGSWLKLDGASHGDDQLFPGPCDVAWDLASAVVEWDLDDAHADALLRRFHRVSGDDARGRLPAHLVGYSAFRLGCVELAISSASAAERLRLVRERSRYRARLVREIAALP